MIDRRLGFVGLGNMGAPMAANLAAAGYELTVFDSKGSLEHAPGGTRPASSLKEVAANASSVFLSLPDGDASLEVAEALAGAPEKKVSHVIDLSTIGVEMARQAQRVLATAMVEYVDAPISGGRVGAMDGTVTVMWAGSGAALDAHREVLSVIAAKIFHVGERPGQGQAMKLLNNFLSATALGATSEALAFGLTQGLQLEAMLEVLNASSGRNTATSDKFPKQIVPGTYDGGFRTALMAKDLRLYLDCVKDAGVSSEIGATVAALWQQAHRALSESDFTRIWDVVREGNRT